VFFNVAQLLREPIGAERTYPIDGDVPAFGDDTPPSHVSGSARMVRTHRGLLVYADVEGTLRDTCGRCLGPAETPVRVHVEEEYLPTVDVTTGMPLPKVDDDAAFLIDEHHHLDLTEAVRQALVLSQPMQMLCRPECAGLCPQCGVDLNQESCACPSAETDPRWSVLGRLAADR
jgi:uncharacterized protein